MIEFMHTVKDPNGMHARPAGLLVKEATRFSSEIMMYRGEKSASVKKLISLLTLSVKCGDTVRVSVIGEDEKEAADAISAYLRDHV